MNSTEIGIERFFDEDEVEAMARVKYSNRHGQVFTETTPVQRRIMDAFNVKLPA